MITNTNCGGALHCFPQTLLATAPTPESDTQPTFSGNTAVVAASADGDKGSLAGAVYVFVRNGGDLDPAAKDLR